MNGTPDRRGGAAWRTLIVAGCFLAAAGPNSHASRAPSR
jgi:hypothetical protein